MNWPFPGEMAFAMWINQLKPLKNMLYVFMCGQYYEMFFRYLWWWWERRRKQNMHLKKKFKPKTKIRNKTFLVFFFLNSPNLHLFYLIVNIGEYSGTNGWYCILFFFSLNFWTKRCCIFYVTTSFFLLLIIHFFFLYFFLFISSKKIDLNFLFFFGKKEEKKKETFQRMIDKSW